MKAKRRILEPSVWDLLETFVEARAAYFEVHDTYESRVLKHASDQGVDRRVLKLDADEVSKLLDFARLESLRNGPCHDLKEIAHALFRRKASTDKLDRLASEIFHELSILKEEQYKVSTFAPEYQKRNELEEYESILNEVHEEFPRKVHHIFDLFESARLRLEGILRKHGRDRVFLRSLFLFGDDVLDRAKDAYPRRTRDLCWAVYARGPVEFYVLSAKAFGSSGFKSEASRALEAAFAAAKEPPPEPHDPVPPEELDALLEEGRVLRGFVTLPSREMMERFKAYADEDTEPEPPPSGEDEVPPSADELVVDESTYSPSGGTAMSARREGKRSPGPPSEDDDA